MHVATSASWDTLAAAPWDALAAAVHARRPTLLTGASPVASWAARGWSATNFTAAGHLGSVQIVFESSPLPCFMSYETDSEDARGLDASQNRANDASTSVRASMAQFIDRVVGGGVYAYLTARVGDLGSRLARDVAPLSQLLVRDGLLVGAPPDPGEDAARNRASLWAGGVNVTTQAHYDLSHNVFVQVVGRKRFSLLPPAAAAGLYLHGSLSPRYRKSQVPLPADLAAGLGAEAARRFPKAAATIDRALAVELGPGDAIYLPPLTLHHVTSLGGVASPLTLSLNVFSPSREGELLAEMAALPLPFDGAWLADPTLLRAATARWLRLALGTVGLESGLFYEELLEGYGHPPPAGAAFPDADDDEPCAEPRGLARLLDAEDGAFRRRAAALAVLARALPGADAESRAAATRQAMRRYVELVLYNTGMGQNQARQTRRFVRRCLSGVRPAAAPAGGVEANAKAELR